MNRHFTAFVLSLLTIPAAAQLPPGAGGVGDLLVAPTRVVLDDRTRSAEIALINTGTAPARYRIAFRHLRMDENGNLFEVTTPEGERFADPFVLYAPRQVTLEPRIAQTIRVRLRLPADAGEGEYRTHLEFHGLPPDDLNSGTADEGKVAIRVVPIYGVSIPLLVRRGASDTGVRIEELTVRPAGEGMEAEVTLERSGARSTYGNVTVRFRPEGGGAEEVVAAVNGIAMYVPLTKRRVRIPLGPARRGGVLRVTYVDAEATVGTPPLEAQLVLR